MATRREDLPYGQDIQYQPKPATRPGTIQPIPVPPRPERMNPGFPVQGSKTDKYGKVSGLTPTEYRDAVNQSGTYVTGMQARVQSPVVGDSMPSVDRQDQIDAAKPGNASPVVAGFQDPNQSTPIFTQGSSYQAMPGVELGRAVETGPALPPALVAPHMGKKASNMPAPGQQTVAPATTPAAAKPAAPAMPTDQFGWRSKAASQYATEDFNKAVKNGNYGQAAGTLARGITGVVAGGVADLASPVIDGVAGFGKGLFGITDQPQQPQQANKPATPAPVAPVANAAGQSAPAPAPKAAQPAAKPAAPAAAPAATSTEVAPGVTKTVQNGRTTYSNVQGGAAGFGGGAISPQNEMAMQNLAGRYKAQAMAQAAGQMPAQRGFAPITADMSVGQIMAAKANNKNAARMQTNDIERQRIAMDQANTGTELAMRQNTQALEGQVMGFKVRQAQAMEAAQQAFLTADTPEKKAAAAAQIRMLNGEKNTDEFSYAPGGQVVIDGQLVTQPGVIFNKRTGQAAGQQPTPPAATLPAKEKLVVGTVYATPRGNAKWDGKQFIPV